MGASAVFTLGRLSHARRELSSIYENLSQRRDQRILKSTLAEILRRDAISHLAPEDSHRLSRIVGKIVQSQAALAEDLDALDRDTHAAIEHHIEECSRWLAASVTALEEGRPVEDPSRALQIQIKEARRYLRSTHTGLLSGRRRNPGVMLWELQIHERLDDTLRLFELARRAACNVSLENG